MTGTGPSGEALAPDVVRVEPGRVTGSVRILLNRPPANAFRLEYYEAFLAVLRKVQADEETTCVLLGSAIPRFFSGGRDLKEASPADDAAVVHRQKIVMDVYRTLYELPAAVIAVIDGHTLGTGLVITSLCDIRVATPTSSFGLPEIKAGSIGGARFVQRLLPAGVVRAMALTADPIDCARAHALGLIDVVAPADQLWDEADRLAARIGSFGRESLCRVKAALNRAEDLPTWDGVAEEMAAGRRAFGARDAG